MSSDTKPEVEKPGRKNESQSTNGWKTAASSSREPALKCPRCYSSNTKFCYFDNYSLSQPRYFCKTCRRYWTESGALQNVPVGGGFRKKEKKMDSSPRISGDSKDSNGSSSSDIGGLKLFQGFSPAVDFQLGGINFPRFHHSDPNPTIFNQFSSFGNISNTCRENSSSPGHNFEFPATNSSPLMGFNFPLSSTIKQGEGNNIPGFQELGSFNVHSSLESSIESLSSINRGLHLKLQLFDNQKNMTNSLTSTEPTVQKPQPILFQNLEVSKPESYEMNTPRKDGEVGNLSTESFLDNSCATANPTPATIGSNVNENSSRRSTGI